jgi:hypothetical protein
MNQFTHNASEPSLSDLGVSTARFDPRRDFPGQTSTGQRDGHGRQSASIARAQRRTRT